MRIAKEPTGTIEGRIWTRLIQPGNGTFQKTAAHAILAVNFDDAEKARMHDLAQRNGEGQLGASEKQELESYIRVANVLAFLHAKARRSLQKT